jgi:DNA-binding MarR family transcriptional regulator
MHDHDETWQLAERFLHVFVALGKLAQSAAIDPTLARLSVNQGLTLQMIFNDPGITQKELSEKLEITPAAVSVSLRKMVSEKLVEKRADPLDGRVIRLYLGPHGEKLAHSAQGQQIRLIAELLSGLPLDEQQTVVEAIERALVMHQSALTHTAVQ